MTEKSNSYGFDFIKLSDLKHPFGNASTREEWQEVFDKTQRFLNNFLGTRNTLSLVARSASQRIFNKNTQFHEYYALEQADVEILLALSAAQDFPAKSIPTSPNNMVRLWKALRQHIYSFAQKQPERFKDDPEKEFAVRTARLQTIYYRNNYTKIDCEEVVREILRRVDAVSGVKIGFSLLSGFDAVIKLQAVIEGRATEFFSHARNLQESSGEPDIRNSIDFFCEISPMAARAWRLASKYCEDKKTLADVGFQISEICHDWIYTITKDDLKDVFGENNQRFIDLITLKTGDSSDLNPEHIYLNNPIWRKPIIELADGESYFVPLPTLIYSFPFKIFERFIDTEESVKETYSNVRSEFLEGDIARIIGTALPSATIYESVVWRDPDSEKEYENDVVAIIGNTIFLFEAKSGRIDPAARRGGELRLIRNFRELFVEPGEQAWRLQKYLNTAKQDARIWRKDTREPITLRLDKPKIVHKFSICMEHFMSLTSVKDTAKGLGLISNDDAWSPVLSLGELRLIWRQLDSEISFFHYLTKRATLDQVLNFRGDEMDILGMYLTNGLYIDPEENKGNTILFHEVDDAARRVKVPRANRKRSEVIGVLVSEYWKEVISDIYNSDFPNKFDAIEVILNQDPAALSAVDGQLRKWKKGLFNCNGRDVMFARSEIGKRIFLLAVHVSKRELFSDDVIARARNIAYGAGVQMFGASDCLVLTRYKKSKDPTYDAVSFFRLDNSALSRA